MKSLKALLLLLAVLLLSPSTSLSGDYYPNKIEPCSFVAHTPLGSVSGSCTTQAIDTPGFWEYWILRLTFDPQSVGIAAKLQPDRFYDMFRAQSLGDGSSALILPLWGDLIVTPTDPDYLAEMAVTAPLYETRPHEITISQISNAPLTFEFIFEERVEDFDPVKRVPSPDWMLKYLDSFYRLGTNRPDGFSD
jgi:hypothetical protein